MPSVVKLGTITFAGNANYACDFNADSIPSYTASVDSRPRRNRSPIRDGLRGAARPMELMVYTRPGATISTAQFWADIYEALNPILGSRYLQIVHDNTGGTVQTLVDITSIQQDQRSFQLFKVITEAQDPYWQSTSQTTVTTATSGTVTVTSDVYNLPELRLTSVGPSILRQRITMTDQTGRGLANYLIKATISNTYSLTGANNFYVFYKGRQIPFKAVDPTGISGKTSLYFRADIPPYGSSFVDFYYSAYLNNTVTSDKLDLAQINTSTNTNENITFNSYTITTAPTSACFSWTPTHTGQTVDNTSYGLISEGSSSASFAIRPDKTLKNDADSMSMVIGSGGTVLKNLTRVLTVYGGTAPQSCIQQLVMYPSWHSVSGTVEHSWVGGFTLTTGSGTDRVTTTTLGYSASAADVQAALEGIYGSGNVSVTEVVGEVDSGVPSVNDVWTITFQGELAYTPIPLIGIGTSSVLTYPSNGTTTFSTSVTQQGYYKHVNAYVRYRLAGQINWTDAWTSTTPGTTSSDIVLGGIGYNCVQVTCGIEPISGKGGGTLVLSGGSLTLGMNPGAIPTLSAGGSTYAGGTVNTGGTAGAAYYNGSIINVCSVNGISTTKTLTFTDVFTDSADTMNIDTLNQQITTESSTPFYGAITFTDPDLWFPLHIGTNVWSATWTNGLGAGTVNIGFRYYDRYIL